MKIHPLKFLFLILCLCIGKSLVFGQSNYALRLNGANDYLTSSNDIFSNTDLDTGSMAIWFRTNASYSSGTQLMSYEGVINLSIQTTGIVSGCSDGICTNASSNDTLNDSKWHLAVVTWRASAETKLYIDGLLVDSVVPQASPNPNAYNRALTFGIHPTLTGSYFNGLLDEASIWSRQLSKLEVEDLMTACLVGSENGLLGHWKIEAGTGNSDMDLSSNTNAISFMNSPKWSGRSAPVCLGDLKRDVLITTNDIWKYNDTGTDLGAQNWKSTAYNDSLWSTGNGILGFGNGNESTVVSFGSSTSNKHRTTYFRKIFNLNNASQYDSLIFNVLRDDGLVVYVNGFEVLRDNMPSGTIVYGTSASASQGAIEEITYFRFSSINLFQNGANTIAVELHQASSVSSDLSFDMELLGIKTCSSVHGDTTNIKSCGSFSWNGSLYDSSGLYIDTLMTSFGCDSVAVLDLDIDQNSSDTLDITACNGYSLNGRTYIISGTYTQLLFNSFGCDSILVLNLNLMKSTSDTLVINACGSYSLNGQTYVTSGFYNQVLTNIAGCDSIVTLDLTINKNISRIDTVFACNSFTWIDGNTYTSDNDTSTYVFVNQQGCDSVVLLNLTIQQLTNQLSYSGDTLSTAAQATSYQWVDCDSSYQFIPGEINQNLIPVRNGNYAVVVENNGCIDTSDCYRIENIGASEHQVENSISIYPNPTGQLLNVEFQNGVDFYKLEIFTLSGIKVRSWNFKNRSHKEDVDVSFLETGVYIVRINGAHYFKISKI